MKKYVLHLLSALFIASLSFTSCSDDNHDNDENTDNNLIMELYVDNIKKNTNLDMYTIPIQYGVTYGTPSLSLTFCFTEDINQSDPYVLTMNFDGVKLEDLNIGDDLAQMTSYSYLLLGYKGENYGISISDTSKDSFRGYQGQVIIKELDLNKMVMKIELSQITLAQYLNIATNPTNEKTIKIKGWVKDDILVH